MGRLGHVRLIPILAVTRLIHLPGPCVRLENHPAIAVYGDPHETKTTSSTSADRKHIPLFNNRRGGECRLIRFVAAGIRAAAKCNLYLFAGPNRTESGTSPIYLLLASAF